MILRITGSGDNRTKNITKHASLSLLYKGISVVLGFVLVPLTINFLNQSQYGIWLTITSLVSWFTFFDLGLGHGLKNKLAEAKAKGDTKLFEAYISTAYYSIGVICLAFILLFLAVNNFINWNKVFNTVQISNRDFFIIMLFVFVFFALQMLVNLVMIIYTADQKSSNQGLANLISQILSIATIYILIKTKTGSLISFSILFSCIPVLVLFVFNIIAFNSIYTDYKPKLKLWKKEYIKPIFSLGINFFFIQIAGIIIFSTDNIIISHLFGPAQVTPYNIAFKLFSIPLMIFNVLSAPYWSAITEAYAKGEILWIKKSINKLFKISALFILVIAIMIIMSNYLYKMWVGTVKVPIILSVLMGIYIMMNLVLQPFTYFINGVGKIRIQLIQSIIVAILNIPLAILFAKYLNLGIAGIILATIVCYIPGLLLAPIQYVKLINNNSTGIWSK